MAPNILRSQLPVFLPGLGHVNCYFLEDERGVAHRRPGPARPAVLAGARRPAQAGRLQAARRPHRRRHPLAPRPLRRRRAVPRHLRRRRPHAPHLPHLVRPRVGGGRGPGLGGRRPAPRADALGREPCRGGRTRPSARRSRRRDALHDDDAAGAPVHAHALADAPRRRRRGGDARRARVGLAAHAGPHRRPPLPVRPRRGRRAVRRPRAPEHHPAHLRARRDLRRLRGRPAHRVLPVAREGRRARGRAAGAARARPPVRGPGRARRRRSGSTTRSGCRRCARPRASSARPRSRS